ncbi:DDE transposase [Bacteroidia bacterium]|nr:DDE transposase [Bacteroidia bacterium]
MGVYGRDKEESNFSAHQRNLGGYKDWPEKEHALQWLVFPGNMGAHLSMDETSILYTIATNKAGKGKKGALAAIVEGTPSEQAVEELEKIPVEKREKAEEAALDMAGSMRKIVRRCFPGARRVIGRFHVQKLACDALQEMRTAHRRDAINAETGQQEEAKPVGSKHMPFVYENGDTCKQLLARSRYLLFKSPEKWTLKQKQRAKILFEQYPDIKEGYPLTRSLRMIFSKNTIKGVARLSLAHWYNRIE